MIRSAYRMSDVACSLDLAKWEYQTEIDIMLMSKETFEGIRDNLDFIGTVSEDANERQWIKGIEVRLKDDMPVGTVIYKDAMGKVVITNRRTTVG